MRTPPSESLPPTYQRGFQHVGHNEPAWMREEAPPAALPSTTMGGPPMVPVHGETTPLRGSAPSTAPSSVGRPGRGGGGGMPPPIVAGMYRPYLSPKQIRRGCCLSLFVGINALTVLSALSVAVADVLSIIYHQLPPEGIAIRVYGVGLCFLVVFTELGWTRAVRETALLQSWVSRGVIYAFVGLLALEQHAEKTARAGAVNLYIFCAGFGLVALGVLYFIMGALCLKRVRDRKSADYTILRSQAELEEALRRQMDVGKAAPYDAQGEGGYSSVVI